MALKERFVEGDVLDGHDPFALVEFDDPVHQEHGIAMREEIHDLLDVEHAGFPPFLQEPYPTDHRKGVSRFNIYGRLFFQARHSAMSCGSRRVRA